jgi:outer membrane lipoprotein-sorting protein
MTHRLARLARLLALSCVLSALPGQAFSRCQTKPECMEAIRAAHRDLSTLTATIVQTKHLSLLDEPLVSTGRLAFKRPDSLLLQMESPRPMRIVIHGSRVSLPELGAEAKAALTGAPTAVLSRLRAIFAGEFSTLEESFEIRATEDDAGIAVELESRDPQMFNTVRTMDLRFERPALLLRTIRMRNALGDALEIALSDIQRNPALPDPTFAIDDSSS